MPVTCIMLGCKSRADRDKISFHVVPLTVNSKYFPYLNNLSRERRQKWIDAISRSDLTPSKLRYQKVCARHFISGKPSKLEDVDNPDWVPSQHLGYTLETISKRKNVTNMKAEKRRKLLAVSKQDKEESQLELPGQSDGVDSHTYVVMEVLTLEWGCPDE